MIEVSTSILNLEKGKEQETILGLEKARTDYIHIDVMDGKFVKKNTYNRMEDMCLFIKRISNLPLDVHLMVENVKKSINEFADFKPNLITFHLEACKNSKEVYETIKIIKESHSRVGIAIKPNTNIEKLYEFLPYIHVALIMTVEPGLGGQTLIIDMINKIENLRKYIKEKNLDIIIEVDGGINLATCRGVKEAGAEMLVSGVAILMAKDYKKIIDELKMKEM